MSPDELKFQTESGELTLQNIRQKRRGSTGGLEEGRLYELVHASFCRSDGLSGREDDTGHANVVLRCPHTGNLFLIVPTVELDQGADGDEYLWEGLHCAPLQSA